MKKDRADLVTEFEEDDVLIVDGKKYMVGDSGANSLNQFRQDVMEFDLGVFKQLGDPSVSLHLGSNDTFSNCRMVDALSIFMAYKVR